MILLQVSKYISYILFFKATKKVSTASEDFQDVKKKTEIHNHSEKHQGMDEASHTNKMSSVQAAQCQDMFTAKDEIIQQKDIIMQKYPFYLLL